MQNVQYVVDAIASVYERAHRHLRAELVPNGKLDAKKLDQRQLPAHGLAYLKTELEACKQLVGWAERIGRDYERSIAYAYVGEVARTIAAGIDLGACESVGMQELGVTQADLAETVRRDDVLAFIAKHSSSDAYVAIAQHARDHGFGDPGLGDESLMEIRSQFARFADTEVIPIAQDVHRKDVLIPMDVIRKMSDLGVFGLTIPEEHGGLGLSKVAMCIVTEELSRGYIGVGSLGTRSEIAAELIIGGGTDAQKARWLPALAAGDVLSTAVFTEPNTGSDLATLGTRAEKQAGGGYKLFGQKTWITHAARANLMTVLARTNMKEPGYKGLSMFLAEKTLVDAKHGDAEFVDPGLTGTEIKVLGYRGMKEYEISFDGYDVPGESLLGGEEGAGFKQLMRTFESARIQTAARGVGVAQAALVDALQYSLERIQFGGPLFQFPRVSRKIGRMIVRNQAARQLTFESARQKDHEKRCDLEAGMAKLLATRAAWEAADANVQIHGGNGFAEEYLASRLLVDARVLSIFEGANEIQANVVARRLLEEPAA